MSTCWVVLDIAEYGRNTHCLPIHVGHPPILVWVKQAIVLGKLQPAIRLPEFMSLARVLTSSRLPQFIFAQYTNSELLDYWTIGSVLIPCPPEPRALAKWRCEVCVTVQYDMLNQI